MPLSRIRLSALVGAFLFVGCSCAAPIKRPGDLNNAVRIFPLPAEYHRWWRATEQCSGLKRPIGHVGFYVIAKNYFKSDTSWAAPAFWGLYVADTVKGHEHKHARIYLAAPMAFVEWLVRHEMLHALIGGKDSTGSWHPELYFRDRCRLLPEQHVPGYKKPILPIPHP